MIIMKRKMTLFLVSFFVCFFGLMRVSALESVATTYESDYEKELKRVNELVTDATVYGTILKNVSDLKKGDVVEVIRDRNSGKKYFVRKNDKTYWIGATTISIPKDPETNNEQMTNDDIELYINSKNLSSDTDYLIWVDINRQLLHVFLGKEGDWRLIKTVQCATGRNRTPTVRGIHKIYAKGKRAFIKGDCWVLNYMRFYDNYMIHSNPVNGRNRITDYRMGKRVSNGCVRTNMEESKWLLYYIPQETTVYVN